LPPPSPARSPPSRRPRSRYVARRARARSPALLRPGKLTSANCDFPRPARRFRRRGSSAADASGVSRAGDDL
jgi:hypothetical protein